MKWLIIVTLVTFLVTPCYASPAFRNVTQGVTYIANDTNAALAKDVMNPGDTFSFGDYTDTDGFVSIQDGADTYGETIYTAAYTTRNIDTAQYFKQKIGNNWVLWVTNDALDYKIVREQIVEPTSYWIYWVEVK